MGVVFWGGVVELEPPRRRSNRAMVVIFVKRPSKHLDEYVAV